MRAIPLANLRSIRQQSGVILIVGLVMVLLISIIALAAIKGSGLQEAMIGNLRGRNLAFQAAESALSYSEDKVALAPILACDGEVRSDFKCFVDFDLSPEESVTYFSDADFNAVKNAPALALTNVDSQPIFVVEGLDTFVDDDSDQSISPAGNNPMRKAPYRITSKGVGSTADSSVIVQSVFVRDSDQTN
jgi:type IV pilus assembly protein PilX